MKSGKKSYIEKTEISKRIIRFGKEDGSYPTTAFSHIIKLTLCRRIINNMYVRFPPKEETGGYGAFHTDVGDRAG